MTFYDGAAIIGTGTLSGGVATFTVTGLRAGTHIITASYAGNSNYLSAVSAAVSQVVTSPSYDHCHLESQSLIFWPICDLHLHGCRRLGFSAYRVTNLIKVENSTFDAPGLPRTFVPSRTPRAPASWARRSFKTSSYGWCFGEVQCVDRAMMPIALPRRSS